MLRRDQITASVVEDSLAPNGIRLTTFQLKYPRLVHSEFMTHRVFSRNASSSRAIPVARVIEQVRTNPAMPVHWGRNQPGMQAHTEFEKEYDREWCKALWVRAANAAADIAEEMMNFGLHKQVANRVLEPYQFMHVVVTATEWENFFDLRDHTDADPNIECLAKKVKAARLASVPAEVRMGQWHLPYVLPQERSDPVLIEKGALQKISAARCARVSYLKHDGAAPNVTEDIALYERLVGSFPIHASPIEHQATPMSGFQFASSEFSGNFHGWNQYRKIVEKAGSFNQNMKRES